MVKKEEIKIKWIKCLRCEYEWRPRVVDVRICPKCRSPYWNKERKNKAFFLSDIKAEYEKLILK